MIEAPQKYHARYYQLAESTIAPPIDFNATEHVGFWYGVMLTSWDMILDEDGNHKNGLNGNVAPIDIFTNFLRTRGLGETAFAVADGSYRDVLELRSLIP